MARRKSVNDIVSQWQRIANNPYSAPTDRGNATRRSRAHDAFNRYYFNMAKRDGFADTKYTRSQYMGVKAKGAVAG